MMTTMMNRLISKVNFFNDGVKQLKSDFFNSLHIQEAELSRLFLQRKIRLQYEQHRRKLRSHYRHGIHVYSVQRREVAFIPSNVYSQHHAAEASAANNNSKKKHNLSFPEQNFYASSNYLSTRRPQEHIRQISRDLQVTLPTVAAFVLVPMVGSAFMFLGLMFPRLLLSRQFHTKQQRWHFATKEFGERRGYFERLSDDFWGSCMRVMPRLTLCSTLDDKKETVLHRSTTTALPQVLEPTRYHEMDAGGPVLDAGSIDVLYRLLQQLPSSSSGEDNNTTPSISSLQNTHIHSLSLANNLAAPLLLPSSLSPIFLQTCLPIRYLQYKLVTLAEDIIADDAALIEEGQIDTQCSGMREDEVLDACWLRGLPVGRFVGGVQERNSKDDEVYMMRKELTNHLQMMKYAHTMVGNDTSMCSRSELVRDKTLQLL